MVELLPLIGGACQILRACLSGVGSIAERTPAKTEKSRLIQIQSQMEIQIHTLETDKYKFFIEIGNFEPVTVGPSALCSGLAVS